MNAKVAYIFLLVGTLNAIPVYQRNIPVEVRYEGQVVRVVPREVQARRNLDTQVQLNPDELEEALKHLPVQVKAQVFEDTKPEDKLQLSNEEYVSSIKEVIPQVLQDNVEQPLKNKAEQPAVVSENEVPNIKSLLQPEIQKSDEPIQAKAAIKPAQTLEKVLQDSQEIIKSGLKNLKESFTPGKGDLSPSSEQWETLEKAVENYFDDEKQKLLIRQSGTDASAAATPAPDQNNWVQNIVNGFNGIANNFVQSIQNLGAPPAPQGQGDEGTGQQPPNQGFQGFVQFFNNGISNIVSTITGTNNNGPTTSNTNLSDSGVTPTPSGPIAFFGSIVSNVQNALGIQQTGQTAAGAQGDTGSPSQQQNGPVQVIQSVGNAITSFFQGGNQNKPPNTAGDEGTAPAQSSNTNIIQNIQNAIQNSPLNPFRPQGSTNTQNPIQTAIQSVGTQVQQLVPSSEPDNVKKPAVTEVLVPLQEPVKDNEIIKKTIQTIPIPIA